jgi:Ca2+-binding RTX toxin-like protein
MKATGAGSDTLREVENIVGGAGNDVLVGSTGANTIWGGNGDDNIDGAAGIDTVSYSGVTGAISISLAQKKARGEGNDKVTRIENVIGGSGNDSLVGDATANRLDGGAGNDVLIGGAGNDTLVGGAGSDTASFTDSAKAITANLATGKATGIGTDSMLTIENLVGGAGNDVLTGNLDANRIDGGNGKDKLVGGVGNDALVGGLGDDNLAGGDGIDIADTTRNRVVNTTVERVQLLREAIVKARNLADLKQRAASIPNAPPIPPEAATLPFETLRSTLLGQLNAVESNVRGQREQGNPRAGQQAIWRQAIRGAITSLLLALGFASGAEGGEDKPSLLATLLSLFRSYIPRTILKKLNVLAGWQQRWQERFNRLRWRLNTSGTIGSDIRVKQKTKRRRKRRKLSQE